jgi:hypothetical protein
MNCYYIHFKGPLVNALKSSEGLFDNRFVVDNSMSLFEDAFALGVVVLDQPFEYTLTQAYNFIFAHNRDPFFAIMHDDAEVLDRAAIASWIARTPAIDGKWYVSLTNLEALAIFSASAHAAIGPYDTNLFDYFMDMDYAIRASHLGYAGIGNPELAAAVSHLPNYTANAFPLRALTSKIRWTYAELYMELKWGRYRGGETPYAVEFNGALAR